MLIFNIFSSNDYLRKVYRENNFLGLMGCALAFCFCGMCKGLGVCDMPPALSSAYRGLVCGDMRLRLGFCGMCKGLGRCDMPKALSSAYRGLVLGCALAYCSAEASYAPSLPAG
jgi:hypothetical protein